MPATHDETEQFELAQRTFSAIATGELDEHLDQIADRINRRRAYLAQRRALSINVGDNVRFTNAARPTYLQGLIARVTKINQKSVTVAFPRDVNYGKFSGAQNVRCPIGIVEPDHD